MKVIKDAMMKWLDEEIEKGNAAYYQGGVRYDSDRIDVLIEVRNKLLQIVGEEFAKLEHPDA